MDKALNRRRIFLLCLFLLMATGLVYWQVLDHEFVNLDDLSYVTYNQHVQAGLTPQGIIWAFTTTHASNWHPLTWLSHMLDCQFYGLNPKGHHLTNLLFHLANTVLLFLLLRRMTGAYWRSAFVATLFALHPLHVESVAWVAERKDVLSTFFWMLTLWAYIRYVKYPGFNRYLLVIFTFALGLMAKPMLVTLPFVLILLDYWPLARLQIGTSDQLDKTSNRASHNGRYQMWLNFRPIWEKAPLLALSGISSIVTYFAQHSGGPPGPPGPLVVFPLEVRIGNTLVSYVTYIRKTFWPQNLAVFYPHPGNTLPVWHAVGAGLLLLCISILVIRKVRTHPYLAVGWLWFLGTLVPVIGLVQVGRQAMADRYTYVPLIGLFIMIAWGIPNIMAKWQHRRAVLALVTGTMLVALVLCTRKQLSYWRNSILLWEQAVEVTQGNYLAHNSLGVALEEQGKLEEAMAHYFKALQAAPEYPMAHYNLGESFFNQGELEKAIVHYSAALRNGPYYAEAHEGLGVALYQQGKLSEAIAHFSQALRINPDYAPTHNSMGASLVRQGKLNEAISHFAKALMITPDSVATHNNMGHALVRIGKLDEAISHFYQALELEPDYLEAHNNLGGLFLSQRRFDKAIYHYRRVLKLKPDMTEAHNNLGVALAYQGRSDEAILHLQQALKLKPDYQAAENNLRNVLGQAQKHGKQPDSVVKQ